ncbi:MAG: CoA transferase [Rhodospirillales bacterium]|nr:CoA transferase [Rhodospirillales bacterium]
MTEPMLRPPPLDGVRVIDLTQIYAGPYTTFLMARAGAEIIKIEPPGGEHMRRAAGGSVLPYVMLNANKRSLTLDLKTAAGIAEVRRLVEDADVLVENFTPGVMDRLGLGWEDLRARNPRLIYACSSGYGTTGPYRDYPAMDLTVQAMSGILGVTGFPGQPPVKAGPAMCDFSAGIHLYAGVITALYERTRSGLGQMVEISMLESAYFTLTSNLGPLFREEGAADLGRTGNRHGGMTICPYNVYPTNDGFVAILCINDAHFFALTKALHLPDLAAVPRYATHKGRAPDMDALDARIGAATAAFSKAALFDLLMAHHVPAAPVRTLGEVIADPHLHARGALRWIDHPQHGRLVVAESPLRLNGCERPAYEPSAAIGADNASLLRPA